MNNLGKIPVYEMSFNLRLTWQAHSLSNKGNDGSIRLLPRRQMLAKGVETDACCGNINKHYHAALLAEYFEYWGINLCPACSMRDSRRIEALIDLPEFKNLNMKQILNQCGLCDTHGFLVTAKSKGRGSSEEPRQRLSKHSLVEFSFDLALPETQSETTQLTTRNGTKNGEGQMLMKKTARSGSYARCIRYKSVGIGVDTDTWEVHMDDEEQRTKRHCAILSVIRDQTLSPLGAQTSTMLPHLIGLEGAIVVCTSVGKPILYSGLEDNFIETITHSADDKNQVLSFRTVSEFQEVMTMLINDSYPCLPMNRHVGGKIL